jgi:hypothetical protein
MKLLDNWKAVLQKAWSVRFMALAVVIEFVNVVLSIVAADGHSMTLTLLAGLFSALALASRFIGQKGLSE